MGKKSSTYNTTSFKYVLNSSGIFLYGEFTDIYIKFKPEMFQNGYILSIKCFS